MRKALLPLLAIAPLLAVGALAAPAASAATNADKVLCYDFNGTGSCSTGPDGITASSTGGGVALYVEKSNIANKMVSEIRNVGYTVVSGSQAARFTFETVTRGFVSVETATCNDGSGRTDVINDPTCEVHFNKASDGGSYANWAAFVADNPTLRSQKTNTPFILLDTAGTTTFTNVELGRPAK
jgi:hypothetical protein